MENASKALLIAGAILIAILLIAIGMMVFNSASGVIDTAASGMSDHEITMHNKKWSIYEGTKSGSTLKELCAEVHSHNATDGTAKVRVTLNRLKSGSLAECSFTHGKSGYETNYQNLLGQLIDGKFYTVECRDQDEVDNKVDDGIISRIYITEIVN